MTIEKADEVVKKLFGSLFISQIGKINKIQ